MNYIEKLKDPRWQRKRLEVMERDNFGCQMCGANTKTLHIHHGYYERGLEPWDYDSDTLHTLCKDCHEIAENYKADIHRSIAKINPGNQKELIKHIGNYEYRDNIFHCRITAKDILYIWWIAPLKNKIIAILKHFHGGF